MESWFSVDYSNRGEDFYKPVQKIEDRIIYMRKGQIFFYARVSTGSTEVEEEIRESFRETLENPWIPSRRMPEIADEDPDVIMESTEELLSPQVTILPPSQVQGPE